MENNDNNNQGNGLKIIAILIVLALGFIGILALGNLKTNEDIPIVNSGDRSEIGDSTSIGIESGDEKQDYNVEVEEKKGLLEKAQSMYNQIQIGDSKESVIQKLGEPDSQDSYNYEYLIWKSEHEELIEIVIDNGIVDEKQITLQSNEYSGVYLGKELNATVEDLTVEIIKIKEGMTLEEVKLILGDAVFESLQTSLGEVDYTWYDKKEQSVEISFEEGKVFYIGKVS